MSTVGSEPKAKHVKDYVLNQLAIGYLKRGDSLPPDSELAKSLGVGLFSVRKAMTDLHHAGVVRRIQKKGTFVTLERSGLTKVEKRSGFALIVPEVRSGIYPSLIKGFTEGAAGVHQQSLLSETVMNVHIQGDTILRLIQSKVAGVAIVPVPDPMPSYQLQALHTNGIPVVFCHRRTTDMPAPLLKWSGQEIGRLAGLTLAELGHKRIGFVDATKTETNTEYIGGLRKVLKKRGIAFSDDCIWLGEHFLVGSDVKYTEEIVERLLDAPQRPTGVFCGDDYVAERLFFAAMRRGLRVPEDLSIISFGPTYRDGAVRAGFAAVTLDETEMGRRAVWLLDEMLNKRLPLDDDREVNMPLEVLRGTSVGQPPPA